MTPWAFGYTENDDAGNSRRQSCPRMHDEREEKGERDTKDKHEFPSKQSSMARRSVHSYDTSITGEGQGPLVEASRPIKP